jgi:flagellar capping protein FliD
MCLPVLAIAGLAAMAGGAGLNYLGQQKADHALSHTFNKERSRQQEFEAEQNAKFQDSLNSTANVADPAAEAAAAARRTQALTAATKSVAAPGMFMPGSSSAPAVVNAEATAAGKRADTRTSALAAALGSLGGMGDLMQANNIDIAHNSGDIAQIGGFKRGSLDVLQSEMDAAKRKGSTLRTLGGLAQSIGQAMLSGGAGAGAGGMTVNPASFAQGSLFSAPSMSSVFNQLPAMAI